MKYQLSKVGYEHKPTKPDFTRMVWVEKQTDFPTLIEYLSSGYVYRNRTTNLLNTGEKHVEAAQIVFLDVEDWGEQPPTMEEYIKTTKILPTFYYLTYHGSEKHDRYRLAYLLDEEITSKIEFKAIAKTIVHYTGILTPKMIDNKSYSWEQNVCGTNSEVFCTYRAYPLSELRKLSKIFIEEEVVSKTKHVFNLELSYEEFDLMCDFFQPEETFEGFILHNTISMPLVFESYPDREDDTFYYWDNYITLVRKIVNGSYYHRISKYYRANTFHNGEHRRKKIKVNCSLIHQIYPQCSLLELLVLTIHMFLVLFSNDKEDKIGREFIWETVIKEWKEPLKAKSPIKIHKRFKKKLYDEYGNKIHYAKQKKEYYKALLLSLYDYSVSLEDNLININDYFSNKTIDNYQVKETILRKYLNEENIFFYSNKDKPISNLKRMIKTNMSKKECYNYLITNKNNIGRRQFFYYKKLLE